MTVEGNRHADPATHSQFGWLGRLFEALPSLSRVQLLDLASWIANTEVGISAHRLRRNLGVSTATAIGLAARIQECRDAAAEAGFTNSHVAVALASLSERLVGPSESGVEVVCTSPSHLGVPVRNTFAAALEMIAGAQREIHLVGYVFTTGARSLLCELAKGRQHRGLKITFIGNRMGDHISALRKCWPRTAPPPLVYSREVDAEDSMRALHAKILLCDTTSALVTSANFSHHGLHQNIEVGLKVKSPVVARLADYVNALISRGEVVSVGW